MRRSVVLEYGEAAVGMMRTLKHEFDPDGIMNPGKAV
jgi:FAD/FMN-containing dehydrogenase